MITRKTFLAAIAALVPIRFLRLEEPTIEQDVEESRRAIRAACGVFASEAAAFQAGDVWIIRVVRAQDGQHANAAIATTAARSERLPALAEIRRRLIEFAMRPPRPFGWRPHESIRNAMVWREL